MGARIHISNPGSQDTHLQPCTEPHAGNNMAIQRAFESNKPNALDYLEILSPGKAKRSLQSTTPRTGQEAVPPAAAAHSTTANVRFDFSHCNCLSGSHCCLERKRLFTKLLPSSAKLRTAKAFPFSTGGHEQVSVGKTSWFPAFCTPERNWCAPQCPCKISALCLPGWNHLNTWKWCLKLLSVWLSM